MLQTAVCSCIPNTYTFSFRNFVLSPFFSSFSSDFARMGSSGLAVLGEAELRGLRALLVHGLPAAREVPQEAEEEEAQDSFRALEGLYG